jgi:hypothetical protein
MSYDIHLVVDHGDGYRTTVFSANMTHNVRPMLVAAGLDDSLWILDGKTAGEVSDLMSDVFRRLRRDDGRFISEREASNGWGTHKQLVPWVKSLYTAIRTHPRAIIRVS